ncbi:MAG: hypothetical protein NVSMB21_17780 [Vulcanimicrobiaceae bacterium]
MTIVIRSGGALVLFASLAIAATAPLGSTASAAVPTPAAAASGQTPPPLAATATPAPAGTLVKFTGQLLDDRGGFVFFTTGDGFRLDPSVKIDDAATGGPTALRPATRTYARATFDGATGRIVELGLSSRRLPDEASYDAVKRFAVALSTPAPNPDLKGGEGFSGKPVLVTFTVEVPSKTPFGDAVYVATDTSAWSATAIRMNRIDGLHYRVSRPFASGTRFLYRYTRGSWRSAERGQNGLEVPPRPFVVVNADVKAKNDIVYGWGDSDQFAPDFGAPIPTPFNPVPFVVPPTRP